MYNKISKIIGYIKFFTYIKTSVRFILDDSTEVGSFSPQIWLISTFLALQF
jgi:hypothetical protein